ncbi:MAG TPA: ABC transporter ATP-binding protein [Longimicrobiales bacterium]
MKELRTILPYLRPYRVGLVLGMVLVVTSNAFGILTPHLVGRAVDALERPGITRAAILGYALAVVAAAVASGAARYGMRELLNGISRRVETDLRQRFFEHLLRLDATFHGQNRTGDLMSRATNDAQAVRMAAGPAVMYLVNTLVMTIFALAFMLRIDPALTAASLVPMLALPPIALGFGRVIHRRFERIQDQFGRISTLVQESLAGVRIVRAYVQEAHQEREFETMNAAYLDRNMALARTSGVFHPLLTLLTGIGMVIVLWFGGRQAMAGRISIGDFIAFGFYLNMLTWPMISLGWVINLFQRGAASMGRLNAIFAAEPAVRPPERPARLERVRGEIEFRDVTFRYPGTDRAVLDGVSFRVPAGHTVALVGPTGAGKSTVIALLARLYDPDAGQVLLDGVPLAELPLEEVRAAIGLVPQDAFVFSDTIAENIALGLPPDGDHGARIREAAQIAQLDATIATFPAGYETQLGERGVNLSGGQRQRTALARAIARDPRILVLDDALSAVDTQTETWILRALRRVLRGRTAIVVSHRVSAVMGADQILVLDDGRIVERGTHAELLARGGLYAALLRRQILEEGLEEEDRALAAAPVDG